MTPEEHADNICRWKNPGLRDAVIAAIHAAIAEEREACAKICETAFDRENYRAAGTVLATAIRASQP